MDNRLTRQSTCEHMRLAGQLRGLAATAAKIITRCFTPLADLKERRIRMNPSDRNMLLMVHEAMVFRQRDLK